MNLQDITTITELLSWINTNLHSPKRPLLNAEDLNILLTKVILLVPSELMVEINNIVDNSKIQQTPQYATTSGSFTQSIPELANKFVLQVVRSGTGIYRVGSTPNEANKIVSVSSSGLVTSEVAFYDGEFIWAQYSGEAIPPDPSGLTLQEVYELALAGVVLGGGSTQSAVPSTPLIDYEVNLPDTLFTVYNDINTARQVVSSIYLDNLLAYRQEVKLNKATSIFINNGVGKLTVSGSRYDEKSITPTKITTNASVLVGKKIALSTLFDSKSGSTVYDKLGQPGATWIYGAKTQLNIIKDAIDNEGGINRMILVGCYNYQTRTSDYKTTGDVVTSGATFARGGWCVANFLRHAMQLNGRNTSAGVPNNVSYYLLGLFTSTGVDFVGNDAQAELIRLAVQGKNPPDYNAAVWDYLKTQSGWTGGSGIWSDTTTNRGFINTWLSAKYVNPDNPFFSLTKAQTTGSTNAFSYQIALDRYKTLSDIDFTTRLVVGSTAGSLVTNSTSYDVCTPTHIVIEGGENDRSRYNATSTQILTDILIVRDVIRTELPTVKIGIMNFPNQGVIFPEAYPRVVTTPRIDGASGNYTLFQLDMALKAALGTRATQITNNVYYLPTWHCMIPYSNLGDRVGYDDSGELLVMGVQNANNNIHPGLIGHNSIGDVVYAWILSTF